ncbi:fumarylacetoacetate hydrolase family protein [Arthrobacter sp. NQ4]|uniref:fumarylacetoacetate hydrolase family protein n=1 Tax=Arthrobacter sp. NQ4 TaxID=3027930 RepID=UPI0023B0E7EA|nr:fumarylacetoacetate hydrolase family protein [Arthrobacter sp. NQ4]MDE8586060.1 fumarylacetoacetate hydrolase family protein [Arthrobacter sp. NQ4]
MKLATVRTESGTSAALQVDGGLVLLPFADIGEWLRAGSPAVEQYDGGARVALGAADFAPLVTAPGKIVCVGLNYREHILEMGRELPAHPTLFAKFADALIGANDPIVIPHGSAAVDWEAELAVVIGTKVWRATEEEAAAAIAGFTVANDISARDFQRRTTEWLQGKTFDATTPLGPFLLTADEAGTAPDLEISCAVDGVAKQKAGTGDLVFGPVELVRYISAVTTLNPGDVILTGTPGGVGDGLNPKEFLADGSTVLTSISGIGECRNTCITR